MKKDGDEVLKEIKLGMEVLYKHILESDLPGNTIHYTVSENMLLLTVHRSSQGHG